MTAVQASDGIDKAHAMIAKVRWFKFGVLNLSGFGLTSEALEDVWREIAPLPLTWLALNINRLTSLPAELGRLTQLQYLTVANNRLGALPAGLGGLKNLLALDAEQNRLTTSGLPVQMSRLRSLNTLSLQGNLIQTMPVEFAALSGVRAEDPVATQSSNTPVRCSLSHPTQTRPSGDTHALHKRPARA